MWVARTGLRGRCLDRCRLGGRRGGLRGLWRTRRALRGACLRLRSACPGFGSGGLLLRA